MLRFAPHYPAVDGSFFLELPLTECPAERKCMVSYKGMGLAGSGICRLRAGGILLVEGDEENSEANEEGSRRVPAIFLLLRLKRCSVIAPEGCTAI